jgi:hypothetical protein
MEAKIEKLKSYLKDPKRAINDNYSFFYALQDILYVRENTPAEVKHDRDIYDLFHATMSLFMQPIGGHNAWFSREQREPLFYAEVNGNGSYIDSEDWDRENRFLLENRNNDDVYSDRIEHRYSKWEHEFHRPHFPSDILKDENIVFFDGFTGYDSIQKKSWALWNSFQSILRWKKQETIKYQRREGIEKTTLQKICDSYCMIPMPYKDKVTYEDYIREIPYVVSESNRQHHSELFSEYLLSDIHKLCNGVQFETTTSDEFKDAMNDPANNGAKLKIRENEKVRVYHLIRHIKGKVANKDKSAIWLKDILKALNVKEVTYKSKYTEVENDDLNSKNKDFKEKLEQILSNEA